MADDWHVQSLFHFTVNVTDFERSIDFYTKVGFRVLPRQPRRRLARLGGRRVRDQRRPKAEARCSASAMVRSTLRLDLLQWLDPTYDPAPPGVPIEERVPRIVALRTSNVRAAYRDLKAQGIEFVSEVHSYPDIGVEAVVSCRDPDGLLVEFIQYAPGVLGSKVGTFAEDPDQPIGAGSKEAS